VTFICKNVAVGDVITHCQNFPFLHSSTSNKHCATHVKPLRSLSEYCVARKQELWCWTTHREDVALDEMKKRLDAFLALP
jgi:hypothetical protein